MNESHFVCGDGEVTRASGQHQRAWSVPPHPVVTGEHTLFVLASEKEEPTTTSSDEAGAHTLTTDREQAISAGFQVGVALVIARERYASDGKCAQVVAQVERQKPSGAVERLK